MSNVWLGVSVEDQKWADVRIPALLETPAAVRWLSCEPLLGPVDLGSALPRPLCGACSADMEAPMCNACYSHFFRTPHVNWVVVGGESGPKARPMHPDWARSLRDQCVAAQVPFFFKQWGQFAHESADACVDGEGSPRGGVCVLDAGGRSWTQTPLLAPADAVRMRRVGKGRAGRVLDGQIWDEFPQQREDAVEAADGAGMAVGGAGG